LGYEGSLEKVPVEYWEYRLVDEYFRGDWNAYWNLDESLITMIVGFKRAENEAAELQRKRSERNYGRPTVTTVNRR